MTPEKLAANRRNAQKSTGPKTAEGRAASSLNSLKHGLLAKTVVVQGYKLKESTREFQTLCQEFYTIYAPVGPAEEMLVDQIVTATWRLRRARTAESGEIALSVDGGWWKREKHNPLMDTLAYPQLCGTEGLVGRLQQTVWGCRYLIHCLSNLRYAVERGGELTEEKMKFFTEQNLRGCPGNLGEKLEQLRAWLMANPEKLEPEALRERHKSEVLKCLNPEIRDAEYLLERNEKRENAEERSRQAAAVLPSEETLDKILRYEAALERQLYRAMHQLERLQRRRQGENIPAPMSLDISAKA
jgi:hypothetical protein